ncbi:MAG: PorT protein [Cyclobacteriaceae bacterium]|nr:MAG: PorT protein [Cyclobacteriaceae bacterium]
MVGTQAFGQRDRSINLPNYDNKWLHYGFYLGIESFQYRLKYSDLFVSPEMDTVISINPAVTYGPVNIGFVVNFRLAEFLNLRLVPKFGINERKIEYTYGSGNRETQIIEAVTMSFPLLLKYKSVRRGNYRMYLIGGINPSVRVGGKKDLNKEGDKLIIKDSDIAIEFGFGLDVYYPFFKFSPEIRFSRGIVNNLGSESNFYNKGIDRLTSNSISLFLYFEGGR